MPGADQIYHRLFSHPVMVEQLIRDFLDDAMAAGLDFEGMEQVTAKAYGLSGVRREGDIIWRLPTAYGTDIYLYLLLEFQSQSDPWMSVRTLVYQGLLWQQIIAEKKLRSGDRLPPVLLAVLYNGAPRWSAETSLDQLIGLPEGSPLWRWQPQARYHLLDMGAVPGEDLAQKRTLAALLVKLEQRQEPETLVPLIDDVIGWFRAHPDYDGLKRLFTELVSDAIDGTGVPLAIPDDLREMRTMLATLGKTWREEWTAKGKAEGKAEGKHEAQVHILLRQLERRFGPVPEGIRETVEAADRETLDRWLDRILD
ncbi:MAG: transposase, partial [Alphaproteobacteria bacterium]|nr:transposase [Alphaproteobacteria bacterium]